MNWQEYQEAVVSFYKQLEDLGEVDGNVRIPDKVTGQLRQVDLLLTLSYGSHKVKILVDAKKYNSPIDVKEVESVLELSRAVGANKTIIVSSNGWTAPAAIKAEFESCDLRILTIEEALEIMVPDMWELCSNCNNDCIVMDQSGFTETQEGKVLWWLAGQCRECRTAKVHCQDCGSKYYLEKDQQTDCFCNHKWSCTNDGIYLRLYNHKVEDCDFKIYNPNQLEFDF